MIGLLNNVTFLQIVSGLLLIGITWIMFEYYKVSETLQLSVSVNTELDETIEKLQNKKDQLLSRVKILEETNDLLESSITNLKKENSSLNFKVEQLKSEINIIKSGSRTTTKNVRSRVRKTVVPNSTPMDRVK